MDKSILDSNEYWWYAVFNSNYYKGNKKEIDKELKESSEWFKKMIKGEKNVNK